MTTISSSDRFSDPQLPPSQQSEEEQPVFEYALENDLTVDSQVDPYCLLAVFSKSLLGQATEVEADGISSDAHLPMLYFPAISSPNMKEESLENTTGSVALLDEVRRRETDEDIMPNWPSQKPLVGRLSWGLEPPLLPSDENIDSRKLMKTVRCVRSARLDAIRLPRETFNLPNEEDIGFPPSSYAFRRKLSHSLCNEKLDMSRDALRILGQALSDDWDDEKHREFMKELSRRKPFRRMSVTPPLIGIEDPDGPFVPASGMCDIALASDLPSLLSEDIEAVEAQLHQFDDKLEDCTYSPLADQSTPKLSPMQSTLQLGSGHLSQYLRLDEPLLPRSPETPPISAMEGLANASDTMRLDGTLQDSDAADMLDSEGIFSDGLLNVLQESVEAADRGLEQERLNAADAMARVGIPTMDFSIAPPQWQTTPTNPRCQLSFIWDTFSKRHIPPWRTTKYDVPERALNWIPFPPNMACRQIEESIDEVSLVAGFLNSIQDGVATSENYVWKKPGLAILLETDDLDDEELEEIELVTNTDHGLDTEACQSLETHKRNHSGIDAIVTDKSHIERFGSIEMASTYECPARFEDPTKQSKLLLGADDTTSTATLLANFIDFRTTKRQKYTKSSFFPVQSHGVQKSTDSTGGDTGPVAMVHEMQGPINCPSQQPLPRALFPELGTSTAPTKIIKALTLPRGIFSTLEKLYPTADVIERDFDRWNTTVWSPGSVTRSVDISPLSIEADIIVSPATGIVITTLIKAIQKPSPGSILTPLRERITQIARRYEHLVVLVSEAAPPSNNAFTTRKEGNEPCMSADQETARDLVASESAALAEFYGFIAGVGAHAYYVSGGEATLARWVVGIATRHAAEAHGVCDLLIQDETQWEVFLRRAGLNAYAAQAILGLMKGQDAAGAASGGQNGSNYHEVENVIEEPGLVKFIRMTPEERLARFARVLGGVEVMNRVNTMLEWRWV